MPAQTLAHLPVKETVVIEPEEVKAEPDAFERIGEERTFEVEVVLRIASREILPAGVVASAEILPKSVRCRTEHLTVRQWNPKSPRRHEMSWREQFGSINRSANGKDRKQMLSEFIAVSGYHPKYAFDILNREESGSKPPQRRNRPRLYDEAARQTLIVLWEASDRVCGKRLKPLLRILLPALERHGHLRLDETIRTRVLAMSAATIDRFLRVPKAAMGAKKPRRVVPEIRRRIPIRTFGDWHEPPPGSMEMDLVAHCGDVNRGSYVRSLVLTDIASAWTELHAVGRERKDVADRNLGTSARQSAISAASTGRR